MISFARAEEFTVFEGGKAIWKLPQMQECGRPLAISADEEKIVVAYDDNRIAAFDLLNKCLHPWTTKNLSKLPQNFLNRYNRIVGITKLNKRWLFHTHYTYFILDLDQAIPSASQIVQNHPASK